MTPWFGDTSFFIALLSADDNFHNLALEYARQPSRRPFITSTWVLVELGNACSAPPRRILFEKTIAALQDHDTAAVLEPEQADFERGVKLYLARMDKRWSLTDCISFVSMSEHSLTEALTSDHHFEQAGYRALLRSER